MPDTPEHLEHANMIKEAWAKLGVNVSLNPVNPETIESEIVATRNFEVLLYGQEVSRDPDRYTLWHSTRVNDPGLNITGFENVRLDKSLEEGRNALTQEERQRHYNIFQSSIYDNAPAIFLYHPIAKYYTSRNVKMTQEPFIYYLHDRFLDFQNWEIL